MVRFLDTNILLRHLTRDDPRKAQACYRLLQRVERGEEVVATSGMVVAEAVFLLHSPRHYGLPRERVRQLLEPLLNLSSIRLPNKSLYKRAFDLYCQRNIGFTDAYNAAYMEARGVREVYSYDTDFDRVEGIRRVEPEA
jgi:predicted nucleic acid-binding protein